MLNPISSPFSSIVLKSSSSSGFDIELIDFDPQKNQFCQFERMEMEESVNSVFPTGALIVRDTSDIITYIADKKIELIKVKLNNGESYEWFITSVTYVNNAASEMDQAFVAIYFTNKIFKESQEVSFYLERGNPAAPNEPRNWLFPIKYPFITTPTHITAVYGNKKVFTPALSIGEDDEGDSIQKVGCGVNLFIKNTQ